MVVSRYIKVMQSTKNQKVNKMKSKILSAIILLVVVSGFTKSAYSATSNNTNVTVLNDISAINKIEIYGNVQLYISDGSADQVKVYNKYYSESALVQNKNGVLRISSYKNEKLVVWVTASDLRSVSAYDNSQVSSFGDISKIEFNVDLHNNATAKLNLDAYAANISVSDRAKIDLTGSSNEFNLNHSKGSTVNKMGLTVARFTESKIYTPAEFKNNEEAGI